jgi:hypothetical protein
LITLSRRVKRSADPDVDVTGKRIRIRIRVGAALDPAW